MYNFRLLRSTISTVFKHSVSVGFVSSLVYAWSIVLEAAGSNSALASAHFLNFLIFVFFSYLTFLFVTGVYVDFWFFFRSLLVHIAKKHNVAYVISMTVILRPAK